MKKAISVLTVVAALVVVAPATSKTLPQLFGTVGPGKTFMLKNKAGTTVRAVKAGKYTITVQDFSRGQNFHLVGPGLNVKTSLKRKGSSGWAVVLRAGTYRYYSDGAPSKLRGSFKVT
jgi:hypothetical protein